MSQECKKLFANVKMSVQIRRRICLSTKMLKEIPRNLKGRKKSSQDWLIRQLKDPYVEKANRENYRCRSAYKLLEINDRFNIIMPGHCVVDIGAAPGSWSQVAIAKTNSSGTDKKLPSGFVVSMDRLHIHPMEGAIVLGGFDFTNSEAEPRLTNSLKGRLVDVILSDMAPNATGVKTMDHDAITELAFKAFRFGITVSNKGSSILLKLWEGRNCKYMEEEMLRHYTNVRWVKPKSSRNDSSETFILGRGFKGRDI